MKLDSPHLKPLHRVVPTLVYSSWAADVDTTIVAGRIVYADNRCMLVDENEVMEEANRRAEALLRRADLTHLRAPWRERVRDARDMSR